MLKLNEGDSKNDDQGRDGTREPMLEERSPEDREMPMKRPKQVVPTDVTRLIDDIWMKIDRRQKDSEQSNLPN